VERFLYVPALGRVRRIAGSEKQESFVGSDLTKTSAAAS
jgi:Outer membrane lipoprotein-sorting protein